MLDANLVNPLQNGVTKSCQHSIQDYAVVTCFSSANTTTGNG